MDVDRAADDEVTLFAAKPNALLYAVEAARFGFVMLAVVFAYIPLGYFAGWPMRFTALMTLFSYFLGNVVLFVAAAVIACRLAFVITNRKIIVRLSVWGKTIDKISIASGSVVRIETNSYDATYGSVYLKSVKIQAAASDEADESAIPIKRRGSIWRSMPWSSPPLYGFYGFKRFDAFANLISDQQKRR